MSIKKLVSPTTLTEGITEDIFHFFPAGTVTDAVINLAFTRLLLTSCIDKKLMLDVEETDTVVPLAANNLHLL